MDERKEDGMNYEVIDLGGGKKSISFGTGKATKAEIDEAIAQVFPGAPPDRVNFTCTYDQELIIDLQ